MSDTPNLALPLVAPSQAQKHVTVNEAFSRLDALVKLSVIAAGVIVPPKGVYEGDTYIVGVGAVNGWEGQDMRIASWSNGQWMYFQPNPGWQAWNSTSFSLLTFDGAEWKSGVISCTNSGSATVSRIVEFEHEIVPGWNNLTSIEIPSNSIVLGVTGRVISALTGDGVTSWKLGVEGQNQQFGVDLGTGINSHVHGVLSVPTAYYTPTPLRLGSIGGSFVGGKVLLSIHLQELLVARPI